MEVNGEDLCWCSASVVGMPDAPAVVVIVVY